MSVKITLDKADFSMIEGKEEAIERAIKFDVASAMRIDTDPYVPYRSSALAGSAYTSSRLEDGLIIYGNTLNNVTNTPVNNYAKVQYYGKPKKSKSEHSKATMKWAEKSKSANLSKWKQVAAAAVKRVIK